MDIFVLASGSHGNATIIGNGKDAILIDMGITLKRLKDELCNTPYSFESIKACLCTHEHIDHTSGLNRLNENIIYSGRGTIPLCPGNDLASYQTYNISDFEITPLEVSHDASNPLGYLLKNHGKTLAYMTDTGYISDKNLSLMKNANYYIIESNHNIKMLLKTNRPADLKKRILGDFGHLSNEDSALYVSQMIGPNTEEVILAHLSEEANNPEIALATYNKIFMKMHVDASKIRVHAANQHYMVKGGDAYED